MSKQSIAIGLFFVFLLSAISLSAASPRQNELMVIGQIKRLYETQADYFRNYGAGSFGTLAELRQYGLIDEAFADGEKYGYVFSVQKINLSTMEPARFFVYARPRVYRKTGVRSFYMSSNCLLAGADRGGSDAGSSDPVIDSCTPTLAYDFERGAITGSRTVASAQFTYIATVGQTVHYGNHDQLIDAGLLTAPAGPVSSISFGHQWTIRPIGATTQSGPTFTSLATPRFYRETGIRSFYIDQTGVLRGADHAGQPATVNDPPIND